MWVDTVSLGNVARSTTRTRYPFRASSMAVGEPAQRAPTTIASNDLAHLGSLPVLESTSCGDRSGVMSRDLWREMWAALRGNTPIVRVGRAWVISPMPRRRQASVGQTSLCCVGEGRGRGARGDVELGEDIAHVPVDRLLAQGQLAGDGLVRLAGGDQAQDLQARAVSAHASADRTGLLRQRVDPGEIRRGAELLEHGPGRIDLETRRRRRPRARGTPFRSARARARPRRAPRSAATRRRRGAAEPSAARASPSARSTAPRAWAAIAPRHVGIEALAQSPPARGRRSRASWTSPAASMIST